MLIATGKQTNCLFHRRSFHIKQTNEITHSLLFIGMLQTAASAAEVAQRCQRHVLFY
ncbi:hypothetical protein SD1617_0916 [Shigella dysenteriae 1617]|nr:hypothetical protein SD1617_0916 [Shigella dysenteriae 1617]